MSAPVGGDVKGTVREHLESAAAMGSARARADLESAPVCPPELEYLVEWSYWLVGRSGVGMGGLMPLSHTEIDAFCRLNGLMLEPYETEALLALDAALRHRDEKPKSRESSESPAIRN